jgi:uroporphyrinogen III methyltransferase / synthase
VTPRGTPRVSGSVALVGAGPGDPTLITVRGLTAVRGADVVVYDRLVSPALVDLAPEASERIFVGKAPRKHTMRQEEISKLLVSRARRGQFVVRLKGGDPFVFGRGGEEADALARAGVPFEIVPGVSSAVAGPAVAGIPLTHRDSAASVAIATAHEAPRKTGARVSWSALAGLDTVVLLMGVERLASAARALIEAGRAPDTPTAVIQDATLGTQRTVVAPLEKIAEVARAEGIRAPAITVIGDVVSLRHALGGWDTRPLSGVRVLVTRTREQASELSGVLRELGADVTEAPAIRIAPPRSSAPMRRAVERLRDGVYAWLVLTSANGVKALNAALREVGLDSRALAAVSIAAVGSGTAEALSSLGIRPDLVPESFTTEAVGGSIPRGSGRVLLMRADQVEPGLEEALKKKGWSVERVTAYRLLGTNAMPAGVRRAVQRGEIDVLTFASGGTVRAFMRLLKAKPPSSVKVVCIGPVTAKAAREAGLRVDAVAKQHTIPGLAAAVMDAVGAQRRKAPNRRARPPALP